MKYRTYEVISYDVWGNAKDGYDVNDMHRTGLTCRLPVDATDKQIVRALKKSGFLKKTLDGEYYGARLPRNGDLVFVPVQPYDHFTVEKVQS